MWQALTNWNTRTRRVLAEYREVKRNYDAWPEATFLIYGLSTGPPVVAVLLKVLPFGLVCPIWILGGFGVAFLTKRYRERRKDVERNGHMEGVPGRLFEVVAFAMYFPIVAAVMALTHHNALGWGPSIVAWVAVSYVVSLLIWRLYHLLRKKVLRLR